ARLAGLPEREVRLAVPALEPEPLEDLEPELLDPEDLESESFDDFSFFDDFSVFDDFAGAFVSEALEPFDSVFSSSPESAASVSSADSAFCAAVSSAVVSSAAASVSADSGSAVSVSTASTSSPDSNCLLLAADVREVRWGRWVRPLDLATSAPLTVDLRRGRRVNGWGQSRPVYSRRGSQRKTPTTLKAAGERPER